MSIRTLLRLPPFLAGFVAMMGLLAPPCLADTITFEDLTDTLIMSFQPNYTPPTLACLTPSPGSPEQCGVTSVFPGNLVTTNLPLSFNIWDDPSKTTLSDTLSISQLIVNSVPTNDALAVFTSDIDGTPLTPLPNAVDLIETGGTQIAGTVTWDGGGSLTYEFQSDAIDVPEPSSLLLLMAPLVGMVLRRHRAAPLTTLLLLAFARRNLSAPGASLLHIRPLSSRA